MNPVERDGEEVEQKVILVDHNEIGQAAPGIENADVVEIIDHHRIADVSTANPILFLNLPIGSTATIVTLQFRQTGHAGCPIPSPAFSCRPSSPTRSS